MMEEDISIILEMGANTIRLAHYQHAQYFYDLCDEKGLVIWAEIPYITMHMTNGRANTLTPDGRADRPELQPPLHCRLGPVQRDYRRIRCQ